jgi:UDP-2,3-diacylglucosamine pyrophosphatase LpxH
MADPVKYRQSVGKGLTRAFGGKQVHERTIELKTARLVILSDQHRGTRDGADDFWRCEQAYNAALGYYLEAGYTLILLGDVEELWEASADKVVPVGPREPVYRRTTALEKEFYDGGRLLRVFGNHDDLWRKPRRVRKHFGDFPDMTVHEVLRIHVTDEGTSVGKLFLVHGHQGSDAADPWRVARQIVRFAWSSVQRRFGASANTPARDFELRSVHNQAMYDWALNHEERPVVIAGHTHQPVFGQSQPIPPDRREAGTVETELTQARLDNDRARAAALRAELEMLLTEPYGTKPQPIEVPCYFNTGCCCFGDGDVTGIEIAEGRIKLVRWLDDDYRPVRKELVADDLSAIFAAVATRRERPAPTPADAALSRFG